MSSERNTVLLVSIMAIFPSVLAGEAKGFDSRGGWAHMLAVALVNDMTSADDVVTYEAFGAIGDGVNDDLPGSSSVTARARYDPLTWSEIRNPARGGCIARGVE